MTAPDIPDRIARLQQQEAAVGAARKALYENTVKAQAAFHDTEQQLGLVISGSRARHGSSKPSRS